MYMRIFIAVILFFLSKNVKCNRCLNDIEYSYRICSRIRQILQSQNCDMNEVLRLRQRVSHLEGLLTAVIREKNAREANKSGTNCVGHASDGYCYFILDDGGMRNYSQAQSACTSESATLAYIDNNSKYESIDQYIRRAARDFINNSRKLVLLWTGASYQNGEVILENNQVTDFAVWSAYHPINSSERNKIALAVAVNTPVSGMVDAKPNFKFYPLCQRRLN